MFLSHHHCGDGINVIHISEQVKGSFRKFWKIFLGLFRNYELRVFACFCVFFCDMFGANKKAGLRIVRPAGREFSMSMDQS